MSKISFMILGHPNLSEPEEIFPQFVSSIKPLIAGEIRSCFAMTEPDAGSDLAGMRSTAVEHDDHWLLNGSKTFISNGINADVVVVAAKTDPDNNPHHMTLFLVERGMEGFERGRNLKKMGLKAQDTAELFFNDVKIPMDNVLGEPGQGFIYLMKGLAEERLIGAAGYLSAAQLSWDLAADYVRDRKVFGKPLAAFQNTQFKLAECKTEATVARVFCDHCTGLLIEGKLDATTASMAAAGKTYEPVIYKGAGHGFMRSGEASDATEANRQGREIVVELKP